MAIAGRWGATGVRGVGGEVLVGEVARGAGGTEPCPQPWSASRPKPTGGGGEFSASDACTDARGGGGSTDGLVRVGMAETTPGSSARGQGLPAMTVPSSPAVTVPSSPAVTIPSNPAVTVETSPAGAAETPRPSGSVRDVEAIPAVVTRLREGRGWTLDVVRPRTAADAAGGGAAEPRAAGAPLVGPGNDDKDPMERGTGLVGPVVGESAPGEGAGCEGGA